MYVAMQFFFTEHYNSVFYMTGCIRSHAWSGESAKYGRIRLSFTQLGVRKKIMIAAPL